MPSDCCGSPEGAASSTESVVYLMRLARKLVQVDGVSEIAIQPHKDAASEQLEPSVTSSVSGRPRRSGLEAAHDKEAQGSGDGSADAMQYADTNFT